MAGYLDEYLVRLGVSTDDAGLAKLQSALGSITSAVDEGEVSFLSLAATVLKFQVEAVGALAAVAGAVGKMAEGVAVADQEYRLFGLTMFMNADAAKKLKITLDALGQPLGMIAWDAELNRRAHRLIHLQDTMQAGMDKSGDEADFMKIRDVRNEIAALEVEWIYFKQSLTAGLAKAFAPEIDEVLKKLIEFNNQFSANLPETTRRVNEYLVPILSSIGVTLKGVGEELKMSALSFTNFVGLLSGDTSIESATFKFDNFAKALEKVAGAINWIVVRLTNLGILVTHNASVLTLLASGEYKGALSEAVDYGRFTLSGGVGKGNDARGFKEGVGPLGEKEADNPAWQAGAPSTFDKWSGWILRPIPSLLKLWASSGKNTKTVDTSGPNAALTPDGKASDALVSAVMQVESGGNPNVPPHRNANGSIDYGLMQLNNRTFPNAANMTPEQNVAAGTAYINSKLKEYGGDPTLALTAYNRGSEAVNRMLAAGGIPASKLGYAAKVEHHVSVSMGDIHVHMPPGSDGKEVVRTISATLKRNIFHALAQGVYS